MAPGARRPGAKKASAPAAEPAASAPAEPATEPAAGTDGDGAEPTQTPVKGLGLAKGARPPGKRR